jgi:hypothetical protein
MIIAELADGRSLKLPDDTPDEVVDAIVMLHVQVAELTKAVRKQEEAFLRMESAFLAPRKITVERDFKDEKVTGATSTVVKRN